MVHAEIQSLLSRGASELGLCLSSRYLCGHCLVLPFTCHKPMAGHFLPASALEDSLSWGPRTAWQVLCLALEVPIHLWSGKLRVGEWYLHANLQMLIPDQSVRLKPQGARVVPPQAAVALSG